MVSHTYQFRLDSEVIRLSDVDDLLGKDVEVTVRELSLAIVVGNFDALNQLLLQQASSHFFGTIQEPVDWQKRIRDEWE